MNIQICRCLPRFCLVSGRVCTRQAPGRATIHQTQNAPRKEQKIAEQNLSGFGDDRVGYSRRQFSVFDGRKSAEG